MLVERAGPSGSLRLSKKHFHERSAELQIPPLRFAPVGMTPLLGNAGENEWKQLSSPAVGRRPMTPPLEGAEGEMTVLFGYRHANPNGIVIPPETVTIFCIALWTAISPHIKVKAASRLQRVRGS
jgi:hypothetical protein